MLFSVPVPRWTGEYFGPSTWALLPCALQPRRQLRRSLRHARAICRQCSESLALVACDRHESRWSEQALYGTSFQQVSRHENSAGVFATCGVFPTPASVVPFTSAVHAPRRESNPTTTKAVKLRDNRTRAWSHR